MVSDSTPADAANGWEQMTMITHDISPAHEAMCADRWRLFGDHAVRMTSTEIS
jgi:hypothetical protein